MGSGVSSIPDAVRTHAHVAEVALKLMAYGTSGFIADREDLLAAFCAFASTVDSGSILAGTR